MRIFRVGNSDWVGSQNKRGKKNIFLGLKKPIVIVNCETEKVFCD